MVDKELVIKELVIKEKKPYSSWNERQKAETKQLLKQKLSENDLSYEELIKRSDELEKEYDELKDRIEEIEYEARNIEYLMVMLALLEMVE